MKKSMKKDLILNDKFSDIKKRLKETDISFCVIIAFYKKSVVLIKKSNLSTFECPCGYKKKNETTLKAAKRVLFEKTGAKDFVIRYKGIYPDISKGEEYGKYYYADIKSFDRLKGSAADEMRCFNLLPPDELFSYPQINKMLINQIKNEMDF